MVALQLDTEYEIETGRIDAGYYFKKLTDCLSQKHKKIVVCDIDGVVSEPGCNYLTKPSAVQYLQETYPTEKFVFITGREHSSRKLEDSIRANFGKDSILIINDRNKCKSSRVLKDFCLRFLVTAQERFDVIDDRIEVLSFLMESGVIESIHAMSDAHPYRTIYRGVAFDCRASLY